jgi:hypothetical protein
MTTKQKHHQIFAQQSIVKQQAWNVVNRHNNVIDTVWFNAGLDAQYVRDALVGHDGYDMDITVEMNLS